MTISRSITLLATHGLALGLGVLGAVWSGHRGSEPTDSHPEAAVAGKSGRMKSWGLPFSAVLDSAV